MPKYLKSSSFLSKLANDDYEYRKPFWRFFFFPSLADTTTTILLPPSPHTVLILNSRVITEHDVLLKTREKQRMFYGKILPTSH